jgi:hypothetical protein
MRWSLSQNWSVIDTCFHLSSFARSRAAVVGEITVQPISLYSYGTVKTIFPLGCSWRSIISYALLTSANGSTVATCGVISLASRRVVNSASRFAMGSLSTNAVRTLSL